MFFLKKIKFLQIHIFLLLDELVSKKTDNHFHQLTNDKHHYFPLYVILNDIVYFNG